MKYLNGLKEIPTFTERHDRNSKIFYGFLYRPPVWLPNTVYEEGTYIIPTVYTGWYLEVLNPGKSGATEPVFDLSKPDAITKESVNGLSWIARKYNLLPLEQKVLGSSWSSDTVGVILDSESYTDIMSFVRVAAVPDDTDSIIVTNTTLRGVSILDPETSFETILRSITLNIGDT